ncbi:MAG: DHHW family protein [Lachnospiraceae bacterium]|nr:DHHW family protein [Lachnospiraceae bacterium]MDD3615055.1 DHHW family protein [Lachnospiraceae bacterium]
MSKKEKRIYEHFIAMTAVVFSGIIVILIICNFALKDKTFSEQENRMLQTQPDLTADRVLNGTFESDFESYVNDQFPFRNAWISLKSTAERMLGKTESNGVYLGKDGYLMEDFVEPETDNYKKTLSAIASFSNNNKDIKQYFMLVPNAVNVESDLLPAQAPVGNQNQTMEAFYKDLATTGFENVDVRDTLLKSENQQLYYRTDHHWTTDAAFLAFGQLADTLGLQVNDAAYNRYMVSDSFNGTLSSKSGFRSGETDNIYIYAPKEGTQPDSVITYVEEQDKTGTFYNRKQLDTKDQYAMFLDGNHAEIKIETPTQENNRLLILKDSYANCLIPFLAPYYREIVVIDPRYYYDDLQELIEVEEINQILFLYNANTFFTDTSLKNITLS